MSDSDPIAAVARLLAVLGASALTAGAVSLATDPGATATRYALLAVVAALAWLAVAGVVRANRRLCAVAVLPLAALALLNPILSQLLLPPVAALGVAALVTALR